MHYAKLGSFAGRPNGVMITPMKIEADHILTLHKAKSMQSVLSRYTKPIRCSLSCCVCFSCFVQMKALSNLAARNVFGGQPAKVDVAAARVLLSPSHQMFTCLWPCPALAPRALGGLYTGCVPAGGICYIGGPIHGCRRCRRARLAGFVGSASAAAPPSGSPSNATCSTARLSPARFFSRAASCLGRAEWKLSLLFWIVSTAGERHVLHCAALAPPTCSPERLPAQRKRNGKIQ